MLTLHAATTNPGKLRDFAAAALPHGIVILPLPGLDRMPTPVEDAPTFTGNADLKALAYSRLAPSLLVFADDSGLEADALHGEPGVLSARYADSVHFQPDHTFQAERPAATKDERNNQALLHHLALAADPSRRGRFRCALSLARNGQILLRAEGSVEGQILDAPRGGHGFGYDPLFFLPAQDRTLAELAPEEKWSLSHRGHAFRHLLAQLTQNAQPASHPASTP